MTDALTFPIPIDGFIFDLDGTVYLGEEALPRAVEAIAELRRRGKQVLICQQQTAPTPPGLCRKTYPPGDSGGPDDVITSAYVLGFKLAHDYPDLKYYVIGEEPLKAELRAFGLKIQAEFFDQDPLEVIDPQGIDAVIVAFDRTLDYRKLNTAYQALQPRSALLRHQRRPHLSHAGWGYPRCWRHHRRIGKNHQT